MLMSSTTFDTVLVANRGEIAVRVIRTLREMGIRSVAVFSDADAGARHVAEADVAVRIGPAPARQSYLSIDAILEAVRRTGAQAVHPGYGFLSENSEFADALQRAGAVFIGTEPDLILAGRRVVSHLLEQKGFQFRFPTIESAFHDLINPGRKINR